MLATRSSTAADLSRRTQALGEAPASARPKRRSARAAKPGLSLYDKVSIGASLVFCAGTLWFLAGQSAALLRLNDDVARLQTQIQAVQADNASLIAKVDELSRPSRILDVALNKLHMRYANPVTISSADTSH